MKLYELSTNYQQIVNMMQTADEDQAESLKDTLDAITDSIEVKADNIAKMMREIESEKAMIDAEIERLSARADRLKANHANLKRYLQDNFINAGIDKIKTTLFSFTIRNNPPSVSVIDEKLIPNEFIKLTPSIDKKAILELLKDKKEVAGVALQQTKSLMIK